MTLPANTMSWSITCSGDKTVDIVTLDQQLYDDDHIEVILRTIADGSEDTLTKTTDYVVGNVPSAAATVTTTSDYSSAYELHVRRVTTGTQTQDLTTGDSFPDEVIEKILDLAVMDNQVDTDTMRRAVKWAKTSDLRDLDLADPADNGGMVIGVNAGGTALIYYTTAALADADLNDLLNAGFSTIIYPQSIEIGNAGLKIISGSGTPESNVTADVGSIYLRKDGGTNTSVYRKESGTGNTGWVAISQVATTTTAVTDHGTASYLRAATFTIGDWNMDSTASVNVDVSSSVGMASGQRIRQASAMIRKDTGLVHYPLDLNNSGTMDGGITVIDASGVVTLTRTGSGFFDHVDFNSTSFNRGWVTIWYSMTA